jgi:hypothetical protein
VTLGEIQEQLISWAGAEARQPWLLAARAAWFARVGEPHDEDKSYEQRMNGLLDHYLYEFRPDGARTTLELFLRDAAEGLTTDERGQVREVGRSLRSLFEVRRIGDGTVELEDVFGGARHTVVERRAVVALQKGDLLEARLLPHDGKLHFSSSSIFHPREVRKAILAEARRLARAAEPGRPDVDEFLAVLSRMALAFERYRNVRVESIYDFETRPGRTGEG